MRPPIALAILGAATFSAASSGQTVSDYSGSFVFPLDSEPIRYSTPSTNNPVVRLQREIDAGRKKLTRDPKTGYLKSLLNALDVPESSQTLVFSKTSFQLHRISVDNPRALYFNDDIYVGYVPGGDVLEISTVDPVKGGVFYALSQNLEGGGNRPRFERRDDCLQCHASPRTLGVPGHIVRSVYPVGEGHPATNAPSYNTDHRSPFDLRFGGWFITGSTGAMRHLGNAIAMNRDKPENLTNLTKPFDTTRYLTPHSDVVAHLVLSHQAAAHNYITRVHYETKLAAHMQEILSESSARRVDRAAEILLRYLLMSDERPLPNPIHGNSGFAEEFASRGPRDAKGRSLRELDLTTRTFKYPLSFLIYSEAFDQLPDPVRQRFYAKLESALAGKDDIRQIVIETKPEAARRWKR